MPASLLGLAVPTLGLPTLVFWWWLRVHPEFSEAPAAAEDSDNRLVAIWVLVWGLLLIVGALLGAMLCRFGLPTQARRFGARARRHRYHRWAITAGLFTAVAVGWALWDAGLWNSRWWHLLVAGTTLVALLESFERRASNQVMGGPSDLRPPYVLYLRAFTTDAVPMVSVRTHGLASLGLARTGVALDTWLRDAVASHIGELVTLGDPTDVVPPEGARRAYVGDSEWQTVVRRMMEESTAIILEPGDSPAVTWELNQIVEADALRRTFIVTTPATQVRTRPWHWLVRLAGLPSGDWSSLARSLTDAGLDPGPDPGPGSLIAFDSAQSPITLVRKAQSPDQLVRAMAEALAGPPTAPKR